MKTLRSILVFLCGIVIIAGCFLYYISGMTQNLFSSQISSVLIENIDLTSPVKKVLDEIPGGSLIEGQVLQQTDAIKKAVVGNEDFNAFVNKYSLEVLNSLANDNQEVSDIDADIAAVITKHESEIKESMGTALPDSSKQLLLDGIKNNLKLSGAYQNIVDYAKDRLTDEQLAVIKFINAFTKPFTRTLSLAMMILASVLIILLKFSPYRWLFPVGFSFTLAGIFLFITGKLVPYIIPSAYTTTLSFVNDECLRMVGCAYGYLMIGVSALIIYGGVRVFLSMRES